MTLQEVLIWCHEYLRDHSMSQPTSPGGYPPWECPWCGQIFESREGHAADCELVQMVDEIETHIKSAESANYSVVKNMNTWFVHYQNAVEEVEAPDAQQACIAVAKNVDPMVSGWPALFVATHSADPKSIEEDDAIPMRGPMALRMAGRITEEQEAQYDAAIMEFLAGQ